MLNQQRSQEYRTARGNWQLPVPDEHALTPRQQRRIKHKEYTAHSHFQDGRCDRCRPGTIKDTDRTTAAPTEKVSKWERT